jgi:hypothetical protein
MARERTHIDITDSPELLRVVEQVHAKQEPLVLQREGEDVAILTPTPPKRRAPSRARPVTRDDALFRLIGIGRSRVSGGVSGEKHEYLAKAYRHR